MTAIHTESSAIFATKNVNVSEDKETFVEYKPTYPYNGRSTVEFTIPGNTGQYVSLKDSFLCVRFSIKVIPNGDPDMKYPHPGTPNPSKTAPSRPEGYEGGAPLRPDPLPTAKPESEDEEEEQDQENTRRPRPADSIEEPSTRKTQHTQPYPRNKAAREAWKTYEREVYKWNSFVQAHNNDPYAYPVDNIFHSMWSDVDVFMNQQHVSTTNTNYMYKSYIETVLNNCAATKKYQLGAFTGFTGNLNAIRSGYDGDDVESYAEEGGENIMRRLERFEPGKVYEVCGYLASDVFGIQASIVNGVEITVKLSPNKDSVRLMTYPPGTAAELDIHDIKFVVCKKKMSDPVVLAHSRVMASQSDASYNYIRSETRSFNVPAGQLTVSIENPYQSNIPARMVVFMTRSDAKSGKFTLNPLNFQHFNVSTAGFYIDDEPTPKRPFRISPGQDMFLEPMMELYSILGKNGEDTDIGLTREEFMNGTFLIPFDVQPTASGDLRYISRRQGGHCRLELTFHTPLKHNINVITYAIFPALVDIDLPRNVRTVELEKPHRVMGDRTHHAHRAAG